MIPRITLLILTLAALIITPAKDLPTVSICYFQNLDEGTKSRTLPKALAEMLISDLAALQTITVTDRDNLEKVMGEIALGQSGAVDETTAPKAGKLLGAQYLVTGTIIPTQRDVTVSCRIVSVETSKVVGGCSATGRPDRVITLQKALLDSLILSFGRAGIIQQKTASPSIAISPDDDIGMDRMADYGRALDLADRKDYSSARDILKGLVSLAPSMTWCRGSLEAVEKRMESYDKTRAAILDKQRAAPVTWASFQQVTISYLTSMQYTKLLDYCLTVKADPPVAPEGALTTTAELLDYYMVLAHSMLKHFDSTVTLGENFMKNYPASMYYSSIKMYTNQALDELRKASVQPSALPAELIADISAEKKSPGDVLRIYRIANGLYAEKRYTDALTWFSKMSPDMFEKSIGTTGDLQFYHLFLCYYGLQDKKNAEVVYKSLRDAYPASQYLSALSAMLMGFAE